MKAKKERKPGRPGRTTKLVNFKLLNTVALRLALAGTKQRPQRKIVEDLLDVALPPLPPQENIPTHLLERFSVK